MEEPKQKCWREEVDENLKRLHSFGADDALEKQDFVSAQILGLRLVGFLDSHCHSDIDEAFIYPIRREAMAKIVSARRSLIPDSDRQAFEQAKKSPGCVFGATGDIDVEKIKKSKYFQALLKQSKEKTENQIMKQDNAGGKMSKEMAQTKSTTMYGERALRTNNVSKSFFNLKHNSSEDFRIIEKSQLHASHGKGRTVPSFLRAEGERRTSVNTFVTKRVHMEINNPKVNTVNPDVFSNGFVTAKAKLVL